MRGNKAPEMTYACELSDEIPGTAQEIDDAWMSSAGHTAMTGGDARIDPRVGGTFTAGDGYIVGRTTALEPGRRIVHTWRTADFAESDADSQIEVLLEPLPAGTRLRLVHTRVPDRLHGFEDGGWQAHYFDPMRAYFASD
jgi:activator of HSP90 ATPase